MDHRNILVTGGAGYIGSHVCHALAARGFTPVTFDNLGRGHRDAVRFGPLVEGDIADTALVEKTCAQFKPLAALHFAALIEVAESVRNPTLFMHNNKDKACKLFKTLKAQGVTKIVFSSTAAVYGMPGREGAIAEDWPLQPINPYGESKLQAESFLRGLSGVQTIVLRYFNAAGAIPAAGLGEAHWPESHLIPNALLTLLGIKTEPLTLFGQDYPTSDGTAMRDYIHVADLADAHIRAVEHLLADHPSEVVNLGTGAGYSVKQVVDTIERVTGRQVPHIFGPRRAGDPPFLVADNKKADRVLGWQPRHDLAAIVASAYDWHQSDRYRDMIAALQTG
jgi:UDP-glucose-4-epimerase GalE